MDQQCPVVASATAGLSAALEGWMASVSALEGWMASQSITGPLLASVHHRSSHQFITELVHHGSSLVTPVLSEQMPFEQFIFWRLCHIELQSE